MARKGTIKPGVKIETLMADGKTNRCMFVKKEKEGAKYGEQCRNRCEPGRPRCRFHGGRAGRPVETGRFSKYNPVPTKLKEKFERAAEDPEILDLTKKIALLESQIWQIAEDAAQQENFDNKQVRKLLILIAQQRKLIAQETDRRITMGTMIDAGQVLMIIGFIYDSILRYVHDERVRRQIGADLRKITGAGLLLSGVTNINDKVVEQVNQ